jgi:hypothetical protein
MSEITTTATPGRSRGRQPRRVLRSLLGLAAVACTLALALGVAPAAQAQVNQIGSHTFLWGDCPVTLGTVKWTNGWAVGGVDVNCYTRHDYVGATVYLWWRYSPSSPWNRAAMGTDYNFSTWAISVPTQPQPPICGLPEVQWDVKATVYVDSYSATFDLGQGLGYYPRYQPGRC